MAQAYHPMKQEVYELKASLSYLVRFCLEKKKIKYKIIKSKFWKSIDLLGYNFTIALI